jgi:biopolymer transport protein ExbD
MTPMVDVAFLLLTFFITTTTFILPDEVVVNVPASHSRLKLPTAQVISIFVDHQRRVFMGIESKPLREKVFGPGFLNTTTRPVTLKELSGYIQSARQEATGITHSPISWNVILKADRRTEFEVIDQIIEILRAEKITTVHFMTHLEL